MAETDNGSQTPGTSVATLAGGCFWCLEAVFEQLTGMEKVVSGYAGGHTPNPNYYDVCSGTTGHAEVVQVTFDPLALSFRDLLEVFFSIHDPTTLNAQGPDVGTQYRSAIFYHDDEQKAAAEEAIRRLTDEQAFRDKIVTEVEPLTIFHAGEDYHQEYYRNNRSAGYCRVIIDPKVAKFKKSYGDRLKEPEAVEATSGSKGIWPFNRKG
jgi:peptide-methionine (S)-S-oxide reductase